MPMDINSCRVSRYGATVTGKSARIRSVRRNCIAIRNQIAVDPAVWRPAFWGNLRSARSAQARGALQKLREIAPLIALVRRGSPAVVVEIGTAAGGTFYAWCQAARADATVVSIDLPGGRFGGAERSVEVATLRGYGRARQQLHFIRADSHQLETLDQLRAVLDGREIDFLFIDGDHTYDGVRRDFEMYAPLVRRGCPIAFHDVVPHAQQPDCEVDRFWSEIKSRYRSVEFIDLVEGAEQYGGIGVLYWHPASTA
jgi:predicted O-methyltransferase YrrM